MDRLINQAFEPGEVLWSSGPALPSDKATPCNDKGYCSPTGSMRQCHRIVHVVFGMDFKPGNVRPAGQNLLCVLRRSPMPGHTVE